MKYKEYIRQINDSPYKVALALAGGGQSFIHHFMKPSGASNTIADVRIPYGKEAFISFCGKQIDHFVSEESARLLATKSYESCLDQIEPRYAIGIGLTCSLASDGERDARIHKMFFAIHGFDYTKTLQIELNQGLSRKHEEEFCCIQIFHLLAEMINLNVSSIKLDFHIDSYLKVNYVNYVNREAFNLNVSDNVTHLVLVPGSYNPYHIGHEKMITLAQEILGVQPYVELSILNADKGVLDYIEVERRLCNIPFDTIITSASTFKDKAIQFAKPGRRIDFVIGSDTWNRILNPKYAGSMKDLFDQFVRMNVRFLVINRKDSAINCDPYMSQLLIRDERAQKFNIQISSTQIREGK